MDEVFALACSTLADGDDLVLVRIVQDRGSTPRSSGARMLVSKDGGTKGTIGGGLLEATAIEKAMEAFETKGAVIAEMDMTSNDVAADAMICGGKAIFVCEYIPAQPDAISVFEKVKEEQAWSRKTVLCTKLHESDKGCETVRRFVLSNNIHESVPTDIEEQLRNASKLVKGSALMDFAGGKYLIDVVESASTVFVFGAGHVGREVAHLAARVGFRTVVLDDRAEFADGKRFPTTAEVRVLDSFEDCFDKIDVDDDGYIIIVTRGHAHDKTVLEQALGTGACYIGMIGSRKKRDNLYKALLSEGVTEEDLQKVHCPIGLAIKTETPEEIAVSIVGELIDARSKSRKWAKQ